MGLRLLAVGDLHLGRRPSRLPESLAGESADLSPVGAWERLVDEAIRQRVHGVALAGDLVEREDDFYEAFRELSKGIQRLAASGIQVVGVAGNHDVRVLPRLAQQLDSFRLLGAGGQWETVELGAEGETASLHGWSFDKARARRSPLEDVRLARGGGVNLGLLHCDRDQPQSPYAPVSSRALASADLDGWLLGHIHAPDSLSVDNPSGYLGSVCGLDPGEPGDHGPWLLRIEGGRIRGFEQWILAPLRWQLLEVDLSHIVEAEDARLQLAEQVRRLDQTMADKTMPPKAVGLRVRLTGRTSLARAVHDLFEQDRHAQVFDGKSDTRYFIERYRFDTRPALALEQLAQRSDPPGLLARRLRWLDDPGGEHARRLIAEGRRRLQQQRRDPRWQALDCAPLDDAEVIDWLRRAGVRLLEDMLDQQGRPDP